MADKPSWQTSTLSQAFFGSLIAYWVLLGIVAVGLLFVHADVEMAKLIVGWASALEASVMAAYLTARKVTGGGVNGVVPEPPQPS